MLHYISRHSCWKFGFSIQLITIYHIWACKSILNLVFWRYIMFPFIILHYYICSCTIICTIGMINLITEILYISTALIVKVQMIIRDASDVSHNNFYKNLECFFCTTQSRIVLKEMLSVCSQKFFACITLRTG